MGTERFRVLRRLGEGGMGVVYEALDRERDMRVALKTLRTPEPRAILRLKHEFRALRDLQHPNLVSFGELVESGGDWFFTMELVRGVDVLSWVRGDAQGAAADTPPVMADTATVAGTPRGLPGAWEAPSLPGPRPPLDEDRLRKALRQLATGLGALHEAGKVHRDIKPSNILVTSDGRVVILDFGLVSDMLNHARASDDEVAGTYVFMAPEQTTPTPVGPPADWYAVGVLLYIALTGRPPIVGSREVLFELKRAFEPPPPSAVAPGVPPDLDQLCSELLRIDPSRRPGSRDVLRRLGGDTATRLDARTATREVPFVGRQDELAELRRAFDERRDGHAVTVLVHGESGVGKSTLVRRFADELARSVDGTVLLSGRCYERESVPYKAIDEVVDALSRHLKRMPPVEAATLLPRMASLVTRVFPVLLDIEPFAQAPRAHHDSGDPHELRGRVFAALRELLTRLCDRQPVVVVIDDLQWADADSLALLAEVLRPPLAPTLLLLATVRSASDPSSHHKGQLDDWLPLLGDVRHVHLTNLPRATARELVTLLARGPDGTPRLNPDAIAEESEGHPLFIDALIRHRLSHGEAASALRLEEALWSRVEALPDTERRLLEIIAVAGRPLPQAVVARAAGLDLGLLGEAASQLRHAHFVRSDGVRSTDAIETYHDKVRSAVRGNLDADRLRHCYERLALALETSGGGDPEALAAYWHGAGDADRAAEYAVAAAARAVQALAFDQGARLYRAALEWKTYEGAAGRDVRTRLGEALAQAGRGAEAAAAFRAAAELADTAERVELERRAADQLLSSGHVDEGLALIETVLSAAGLALAKTPRRAALSLLFHRARLKLRGTRYRERDRNDLAPRLLKTIDLSFSVAQGLIWVDVLRGAEFQTRLIRVALDAGEPYRLARALALEAGFASTAGAGGRRRAVTLLATAETLARRCDEPQALGIVYAAAGFAALARQSYRHALELNQQAERILSERCVGAYWELALARTNLLFSLSVLGDLAELGRRGRGYVRAAQERGDLFAATSMACGPLPAAALAEDDPARARLSVEEAIAKWSQHGFHLQHFYALTAYLQTDLYEGRGADAHRRIVEAWPSIVGAQFLRMSVTRWWSNDMRGRAAVAAAREATGTARDKLLGEAQKLARALDRERLPGSSAQAAAMRAGVASVRGDVERAVAELDEAVRLFDSVDMALVAQCARHARGRLVGGDGGRAEAAAAAQAIEALGVRVPERLQQLVIPIHFT